MQPRGDGDVHVAATQDVVRDRRRVPRGRDAQGSEDTLESPSAKIVLGQVVEMGTGAFGLRYDMKRAEKLQAAMLEGKKTF